MGGGAHRWGNIEPEFVYVLVANEALELYNSQRNNIFIYTRKGFLIYRYLVERWLPSYSSQKEMVI